MIIRLINEDWPLLSDLVFVGTSAHLELSSTVKLISPILSIHLLGSKQAIHRGLAVHVLKKEEKRKTSSKLFH